MFAYSPRDPTQAAKLPDQIEQREKTRRLEKLIEIQNAITVEINKSQAGRTFEVLVEGRSHKNPDMWQGQTRGGKTVHFAAGRELAGQFVRVRAKEGHLWGFKAELI
jgi:tRNA-2-methylthio-N6-dimethylallyladenosine synthase